ncbi:hypothetical protein CEXT_690651 [Caerostris extrusa]|uniref:Uncharacterized protein n=1 Tax=Caerostris extrusa TaxID=172846 RepID=A0AAV4SZI8_CAEEX|nr:hypothetical protein CEXT_690651 [Caerostris extrusa]
MDHFNNHPGAHKTVVFMMQSRARNLKLEKELLYRQVCSVVRGPRPKGFWLNSEMSSRPTHDSSSLALRLVMNLPHPCSGQYESQGHLDESEIPRTPHMESLTLGANDKSHLIDCFTSANIQHYLAIRVKDHIAVFLDIEDTSIRISLACIVCPPPDTGNNHDFSLFMEAKTEFNVLVLK